MLPSHHYLTLAAQLARSGEREQARRLCHKVLAQDPGNLQAWLWLSELAEKLEEQIAALEQAAQLCPAGGPSLQALLVEIRGAIPLGAPGAPPRPPAPA